MFSIVVVTWNCAAFIERFIRELHESLQSIPDWEVLILDNASSDATPDLMEKSLPEGFHLVRSSENLGFAKGNNRLLRDAKNEYVVLLNPDVFDYPEGFWQDVLSCLQSNSADVGFVRLNNADGSFQDCIGEFPSVRRALRPILGGKVDYSAVRNVGPIEVGIMAFMLTKKSVLERIGYIDEDFHMYSEDVEWCYRARKSGLKTIYMPQLCLTHIGGASSAKRWKERARREMKLGSELLFVRKHYSGSERVAMELIVGAKRLLNRVSLLIKKEGAL